MAAFRIIFSSIFILCTIFSLSDSDAIPDTRSRVRRAIESMDDNVISQLVGFVGSPIKLIIQLLECYEQEVQYLNCNFNFSFDPFYVVKQCALKDDELKIVADRIEKAIPAIKVNLAVPPKVSKEVCFGGIPPNLLANSPNYLNAMPIGSKISAQAGLAGIGARNFLDIFASNVYTVLRGVLSLGTKIDVPTSEMS